MKHRWRKDESGYVDLAAWDYEFHSGPICDECLETFCANCARVDGNLDERLNDDDCDD